MMYDAADFMYVHSETGLPFSLQEVEERHPQWFSYMMQCAKHLGIENEPEAIKRTFWDEDPHHCWFWCYDDGYRAASAVAKYRSHDNGTRADS